MTCQRLKFGAVLAALVGCVELAALAGLAACGGSSSETPPPLEPDPRGFHYAPALPTVSTSDSDAGDVPMTNTGAASSDDDDKPRPKAGSTWGEPSSLPK